jgi:hypothetical protein
MQKDGGPEEERAKGMTDGQNAGVVKRKRKGERTGMKNKTRSKSGKSD